MSTPYTVDALMVGKKLRVRTDAAQEVAPRPEQTYTIERRADGLYISGYNYGTDTGAAAVAAGGGVELRKLWFKCRSIGRLSNARLWSETVHEDNILVVGQRMYFRLDDVHAGEGKHEVTTREVLEITEE